MDQDQIDALTGGEHTDLHHHDDFYYRQSYLDAELAKAVWLDGTRVMTGDLQITKDAPGITLTDDGGLVGTIGLTDSAFQIYVDPDDLVASSGLDVYIDGTLSGDKIASINANGLAVWGYVSITGSYLQVAGDEGADGYIYLYADQGDDPTSDFWRIRAGDDGLFAIQNWPVSGWVDILTIDPSIPTLTFLGESTGTCIIGSAGFGGGSTFTGISLNGTLNTTDYNLLSDPSDQNLYINAPTGKEIQLRINNAIEYVVSASAMDFNNNILRGVQYLQGEAGLSIYPGDETDDPGIQIFTGDSSSWAERISISGNIATAAIDIKNSDVDIVDGTFTIASGIAIDSILDQDDFYSDSNTALATQQSIKAYVDSEISDLTTYVDDKSYLDLGSILTSNGSYTGTKISVTVDDASTVFGNVLAQAADFNYDRADADAATSSVGLVLALSSGSGSKEVLIEGMACNTSWTWSAGLLYLSTTTGAMTQTAPSGTGDQVVAVGWALSATCIYFKPSLVLVEVA